jgi:hypothetical protein
LAGDAIAFKCIYAELKEIINEPCKFAEESIFQSLSLTDVSPHLVLSDSEIDNALKPIMEMAKSPLLDSQREGTFIICNLVPLKDSKKKKDQPYDLSIFRWSMECFLKPGTHKTILAGSGPLPI